MQATGSAVTWKRTAAGIVALIDADMAKVLRIVSVERGLDPRDFVLMAFGGGGPLHACALADDLGMRRVVVPRYPGLFSSAFGLLAADVRATLARTLVARCSMRRRSVTRAPWLPVLTGEARDSLRKQGVAEDAMRVVLELDVRYAGQSFDLTVPFDGDESEIAEAFHQRHERRYGYAARDERVELATVRVAAMSSRAQRREARSRGTATAAGISARFAPDDTRRVWDDGAFVDAAIYQREDLAAGAVFEGPAIVEQYDTTTWVPRGWRATVDATENLLLEKHA